MGSSAKSAAPEGVSIDQLVTDPEARLDLVIRAGRGGLERTVRVPRIQKPGLALAGYAEQLHRARLQIIGATEIEYMQTISAEERRHGIATVMDSGPAAVIVARGLEPPAELVDVCERHQVPLLVSELISAELIARATGYLRFKMAPSASIHGVLLDVLGVGVLLLGKSGIGKSETALDLVCRGHRLVADDIVNVRQHSSYISGTGSGIIRHHMEIRGLGIINIKDLFGISAVRDTKKVELVIELHEWDQHEEYDRLGIDERVYSLLELEIPFVRLPVRPGRNVATIIEVAARNHLLKQQGHHSARAFQDRLNRAIAEARPQRPDVDVIE